MFEKDLLNSDRFIKAFEESGSVGESRGMIPLHSPYLNLYSKTHSYGEYIFDWSWANAYAQYGIPYYPKLISMVPFTPATHRHLNSSTDLTLIQRDYLPEHSSCHFLFISPAEFSRFEEAGFLIRESFQYHFLNQDYGSFEDLLKEMKGRKAKAIRQERRFSELTIERLRGDDLTREHGMEMYHFYLSTLEKKGAIPYLTQNFFERLFTDFKENTLYVRALRDKAPIAGALFYFDEERLFGRYWGARDEVRHLHFELCYYQGIEFCIERNLKIFEAGAQGEHKIARGFRPVRTYSAHLIKHRQFKNAIDYYIAQEKSQIERTIIGLNKLLPFKS